MRWEDCVATTGNRQRSTLSTHAHVLTRSLDRSIVCSPNQLNVKWLCGSIRIRKWFRLKINAMCCAYARCVCNLKKKLRRERRTRLKPAVSNHAILLKITIDMAFRKWGELLEVETVCWHACEPNSPHTTEQTKSRRLILLIKWKLYLECVRQQ